MKIMRTDCRTGKRTLVARFDGITTYLAEKFMVKFAQDEALLTAGAVQVNFPGGLSGRASATIFDPAGLERLAEFSQEWPQS